MHVSQTRTDKLLVRKEGAERRTFLLVSSLTSDSKLKSLARLHPQVRLLSTHQIIILRRLNRIRKRHRHAAQVGNINSRELERKAPKAGHVHKDRDNKAAPNAI